MKTRREIIENCIDGWHYWKEVTYKHKDDGYIYIYTSCSKCKLVYQSTYTLVKKVECRYIDDAVKY